MNTFSEPKRTAGLAAVFALSLFLGIGSMLAGCAKKPEASAKPRPVKAVRIAADGDATPLTFSGEVRARYETKLAFRIPGKVLSRHVDVGNSVKKGQVLARLDPSDYRLAAQALAAQLSAARKDRDFAKDDLDRYRDLLEQKLISRAEYDRRETSFHTANDRVAALEAQLKQAEDQVEYAALLADRDAVVTALYIEAGHVVTAGQPIVALAQLNEKEIAISVPEHQLAGIRGEKDATATLWAEPDKPLPASVREVAPSADPASRTYAVRVRLKDAPAWVQLGMTASVSFRGTAAPRTTIPLPALFQPQDRPADKPRVWVVNEQTHTVTSVPVRVGEMVGEERIVVEGLERGQRVVVAGASRLREGQSVRILDEGSSLTYARRGKGTPAQAEAVEVPTPPLQPTTTRVAQER